MVPWRCSPEVMLRLVPSPPMPSVDGARRSFTGRGLAGLGVLATIGLNSLIAGCASTPPSVPPLPGGEVGAGGLRPSPSGSVSGHFGALPPALTPDSAARELVAQALLLVGSPYRWGGSRAESGFDCSGLIRYVFAESLQWRLPGSAREQFRVGQEVDRDSLLPADLLFFSTAGTQASHVGLCIGPRRFVHAPSARGVVRIEELRGHYWLSQFDGGRRLILRS
jgi:cell wall-associated NlpC family hydrolase